jgi:hypothetical protein
LFRLLQGHCLCRDRDLRVDIAAAIRHAAVLAGKPCYFATSDKNNS